MDVTLGVEREDSQERCWLLKLSHDLLRLLCTLICVRDALRIAASCKMARRLLNDDLIWRQHFVAAYSISDKEFEHIRDYIQLLSLAHQERTVQLMLQLSRRVRLVTWIAIRRKEWIPSFDDDFEDDLWLPCRQVHMFELHPSTTLSGFFRLVCLRLGYDPERCQIEAHPLGGFTFQKQVLDGKVTWKTSEQGWCDRMTLSECPQQSERLAREHHVCLYILKHLSEADVPKDILENDRREVQNIISVGRQCWRDSTNPVWKLGANENWIPECWKRTFHMEYIDYELSMRRRKRNESCLSPREAIREESAEASSSSSRERKRKSNHALKEPAKHTRK